jgi:hypothetical protein
MSRWSRSTFLHAAGWGAVAGVAGCGGAGGAATPATANATPTAGPSQTAAITISRTSTSGAVPAALAGLSYEKSKLSSGFFNGANSSLIGCCQRLGPSILRIGGNSVDQTTWTPGGAGSTAGQVAPADISGLAAFAQSAGWRVIYGINLATNTPAAAAAEASVAAQALGGTLFGFEIGNECDLYHSNGLRPSTYTLADFETEWSSYASAIRTSVPNAPLTGPAAAGSAASWTVPFAAAEASSITLLTQHYYRANGQLPTSTLALLLGGDPNLPAELAQLQAAASAHGISGGYRLGEANSFYNGGAPNVSDAYGTALWAIDFLLLNAQNGSAGVNFHGGGNGTGYTPIADASGAVVEVRPVYYGMLFVAQIPSGAMYRTTVTSSLQLSAYAVAGSNGTTWVVINNKDASNTAVASIALGAPASRAVPLVLAGTGLNATSGTTLGGAGVASNGAWSPLAAAPIAVAGSALTVNVAPASAVLLAIS